MLSTLVSLLPTRFKWLRRLRYALLLALMVRAWMMQQNQDTQSPALAPQTVTPKSTAKRKSSTADA